MILTEQQKKDVEKLASINYTVRQISLYLDIENKYLQQQFAIKTSDFRVCYDRGQLISQAKIDIALVESAEKQNMTAIVQLERIRTLRNFENHRDQLIHVNP